MLRIVGLLVRQAAGLDHGAHVGGLEGEHDVVVARALQHPRVVEAALHHALGSHAAVFCEDFLFNGAGVHADAHRDAVLLQAVRQRAHVGLAADVAGIDAHLGDAVFDGTDGELVVEVDVGHQRHRGCVHQRAHGLGAGLVVDGHAHDVRACVRHAANLRKGGLYVASVGVGHGLNGNGRAAADGDAACENLSRLHVVLLSRR